MYRRIFPADPNLEANIGFELISIITQSIAFFRMEGLVHNEISYFVRSKLDSIH